MRKETGRYSGYLRPFSYAVDLLIINVLAYFFILVKTDFNNYQLFISLVWVVTALNIGFYEVYRYTKGVEVLEKIVKQYFIFIVLNFAYLGFFLKQFAPSQMLKFVTVAIVTVSVCKLLVYYLLKKYRVVYGGNFRNVIVIGKQKNVQQLIEFFTDNPNYGYKLVKTFDFKTDSVADCLDFAANNKIDEIYGALSDLNEVQKNYLIDFSDNNLKVLKFLPDPNEILSQNSIVDYYGYIPLISLRRIPLDSVFNQMVKRSFDILFSISIILFILSWLIPLLAFLVKIESKGPVFFKQKRNGLNYKEFNCYKFRSMRLNEIADLEQVSKNDIRITNTGRFIRKTSIDELPQFINVLLGDMSVVGPRPHMVSHTEMYAKSIDKFMVRHFIKPGITGLAQTNGYRGEVESKDDITNRVKFDIFYVENWSLLIDIKIVITTIINAIKGEEKAY
ncbi:MAG: exopolysaccharide biosynthesis polyprenyl glycosylphosphotransferase [Flavobacterium sp.]|nr:exopolysaccharide biosynthesis polyprenyl glycosylphosphotransferase [Flavobacterium sp.]